MYRQDAHPNRSTLVTAFAGKVFGLDRRTGATLWTHALDQNGVLEIAIHEGVVIVVTRGTLSFIDYATGRGLARVTLVGQWAGRPTMIVDDGHIYIGRHGELSCYKLTGQPVWNQPFPGQGMGGMALGLPGNLRQADDNT